MKKFKIRVTKASLTSYWYAEHIGNEFWVVGENESKDAYYVIRRASDHAHHYIVEKNDCIVLKTPEIVINKALEKYNHLSREELATQLYLAEREASDLAVHLREKYFYDKNIEFSLCDSVAGIISQIDNMTCGMTKRTFETE